MSSCSEFHQMFSDISPVVYGMLLFDLCGMLPRLTTNGFRSSSFMANDTMTIFRGVIQIFYLPHIRVWYLALFGVLLRYSSQICIFLLGPHHQHMLEC